MKKTTILTYVIAVIIALFIIHSQRQQQLRGSNAKPMTTAEHRALQYQYEQYLEGRE